MIDRIFDIAFGAAAMQGLFLAAVLIRNKKGNRRANVFLCILMVSFSLIIIHSSFLAGYFGRLYGNPLGMKEPHALLLGPLLFFYVRELVSERLRFKIGDFFHMIPYVLYFVVVGSVNLAHAGSAFAVFFREHAHGITAASWGVTLALYLFYAANIARITGLHGRRIEEEYSRLHDVGLRWVRGFMAAFALFFFALTVAFVVRMHGDYDAFNRCAAFIMAATVYLMGYRALRQPDLFAVPGLSARMPEPSPGRRKYLTSGLTEEDLRGIESSIVSFMEKEKPFLDPDFSLEALSQGTGIPKNAVSQALNTRMGVNFFNFVNRYRIEEVTSMMEDPRYGDHTLLSLAFGAGFDSKATFNSMFKKIKGVTPSQFRARDKNKV